MVQKKRRRITRRPAPEQRPEVEPGTASEPESAPSPAPARLHLGDGVANFSREDHFHETPGGWLECEDCVKALEGGVGIACH